MREKRRINETEKMSKSETEVAEGDGDEIEEEE
jgi:hypothetical protein